MTAISQAKATTVSINIAVLRTLNQLSISEKELILAAIFAYITEGEEPKQLYSGELRVIWQLVKPHLTFIYE